MAKSVFYGLMAGFVTCGAFALVYTINPVWMLSTTWWWASLLIYVVGMYAATRAEPVGAFPQMVRAPFLVFVLANALFYVFFYVLFTFVDPGLYDVQAALLEKAGKLAEAGGAEGLRMQPGALAFGYANSLIGGFILAALITLVEQRR